MAAAYDQQPAPLVTQIGMILILFAVVLPVAVWYASDVYLTHDAARSTAPNQGAMLLAGVAKFCSFPAAGILLVAGVLCIWKPGAAKDPRGFDVVAQPSDEPKLPA